MNDFEDKIDQYIAEKFGDEIEEKLNSINFDSMIFFSPLWTVGFLIENVSKAELGVSSPLH